MGISFFGGTISKDSYQIVSDANVPDKYYLNNFNDLGASFVTLFALMVVNNWFVIV